MLTTDRLYRALLPFEFHGQALVARALSGPENDERNLHATRTAMLLERKLKDPESVEYWGNLRVYDEMAPETLRELLLAFRRTTYRQDAVRDEPPTYIPFPENATEEQKREVLARRDEEAAAWGQRIDESVKRRMKSFEDSLATLAPEALLAQVKRAAIYNLTNAAANDAFVHYSLYLSIQTPQGERRFASVEEAAGLPDPVVTVFYQKVREVNEIDPLAWSGPSSMDLPTTFTS